MSRSSTTTYNFSTSARTSGGAPSRPIGGGSSRIGGSSKSGDPDPVIKNVDMEEETQQDVIDMTKDAMRKFDLEKEQASYIKKELDIKFGPTWHVVVGKHFASFVTHETKCFIYFYIGSMAFLIFRSG